MSASALIRVLGLGLGLGLITVAMSELFFYPVDHLAAVPTLLAFYAPMALFGFAALERTGRWAFGPVVLSAAIFGWTVEGVLVTQAYEALPMSLIWTALSWHGVFTVGIALIGLRCALLSSRIWVAPIACAVFSLFAALWGVFAWTTLLEPELQAVIGHDFGQQLVLAVAMIALGHLVLDYTPARAPVGGWVLWVLALLALAVWSISWAVPLFPISLWLPLLIGASALALWRARAISEIFEPAACAADSYSAARGVDGRAIRDLAGTERLSRASRDVPGGIALGGRFAERSVPPTLLGP